MALKSSVLLLIITILLLFPLLSSPVFAFPDPPKGLLSEEKTRLGSTPPSCYNKCNACHPCTAVKVTTFPRLHRAQAPTSHQSDGKTASSEGVSEYDSFSGDTNYKPLGWKCRCKDHLYNP